MRIRSTIIAILLALLSVGAAYLAWRQDRHLDNSTADGPRALFARGAIPIDSIERVTLARAGAEPMVFERRGSEWMQTEPVEYPVDVFSMRQLAIAAQELETVGAPEEPPDAASLETLSLQPPLATLTLEWPDGSQTLHLGRKGVGGLAYLQIEGDDRIHLVRQTLHDRAVEQSPFEWRRRRVFDVAGVDSSSAAFEEPGGLGYALERARRGWTMSAPIQARLDPEAVDAHLAMLASMQVTDFIADGPAALDAFGLASPRAVLAIATPVRRIVDGEAREDVVTERLLIGGPQSMEPGAASFAMIDGRPVVFTLPRAVIERAAASGHLIDLRALDVNPADVRSIRISGETEFTLIRDREDPTRWVALDAAGAPVSSSAVAQLFESLTVARAVAIDDGDFPFDRAVGHVMFFDYNGEALSAVQVARQEDGRWLLFSDDHVLRIFPASMEIHFEEAAYLEGE